MFHQKLVRNGLQHEIFRLRCRKREVLNRVPEKIIGKAKFLDSYICGDNRNASTFFRGLQHLNLRTLRLLVGKLIEHADLLSVSVLLFRFPHRRE